MTLFLARAHRARVLSQRWPYAAALLRFLAPVFEIQDRIAARPGEREGLRDLLHHARDEGPPLLAGRASHWLSLPLSDLSLAEEGPDAFFSLVLRQCAPGVRAVPGETGCPRCGGPAVASLLRDDPDARALRRELLCGWCGQSWSFTRVCCPSCGEERAEKLPRLVAEDPPYVSIEGCTSCKHYLKSIEMDKDRDIEPTVDEIASLPLDVLARAQGFRRMAPNLAGM